jgi:hypothetical protein
MQIFETNEMLMTLSTCSGGIPGISYYGGMSKFMKSGLAAKYISIIILDMVAL